MKITTVERGTAVPFERFTFPDGQPHVAIVRRGVLGWGNRKGGCEAYGPGGRWSKLADGTPVVPPNGEEGWGDLLGDDLEREGMSEGADLIVIAVPRQAGGSYDTMNAITTRLHAAALAAVDEVMADITVPLERHDG